MRFLTSKIPDWFWQTRKRVSYIVSAIIIISVCVQYWPSEGINILEPEPPTGHYGWVLNSDTGELEYVQIPSTTFYHFANATASSHATCTTG